MGSHWVESTGRQTGAMMDRRMDIGREERLVGRKDKSSAENLDSR
jgi:hypothetical protein